MEFLKYFKTEKCTLNIIHNLQNCFHYHNEKDIRVIKKSTSIKTPVVCPRGTYDRCEKIETDCNFSHNKIEQLYHNLRYKS